MGLVLTRVAVVVNRIPATLTYAAILTAVTTALLASGPDTQDRVISAASTNLHNLRHGHFGTLVGSAFVIDGGPIYGWLPGLMCLLALAELFWRSGRLVATFAFGHIGATLLVALGLTVAVREGWAPVSVSRDIDVGMSYGAAAVLGALTAAIPPRWRAVWVGWWLGAGLAVVGASRDFTDAGHVTALLLGMLAATRLGRPDGWTLPRRVLLVVAAAFGLLLVAGGTGPLAVISAAAGVCGAVAGYGWAQVNSRAEASTQSERHDSGGSSRSSPGISQS